MRVAAFILAVVAAGLLAGCDGDDAVAADEHCAPGSWRAGPVLEEGREDSATVLLPDGRVLVAGGHPLDTGWVLLKSAEIYDPARGTWAPTGSMTTVRYGTGARTALLAGGLVLTAEQRVFADATPDPDDELSIQAELFDPPSETWAVTGWMSSYVNGPLVALPDGDALVVGGIDWPTSTVQAGTQRYQAASGTWIDTAPMSEPRTGHAAIAIGDKVLALGGAPMDWPAPPVPTAELYDPETDQWRSVGSMAVGRWLPKVALLHDGRVLVAGDGSAEVYDPATETWTATASMLQSREVFTLSTLHDGRVLAAGGRSDTGDLASTEIYDPEADTWSSAGTMAGARRLHTAITLDTGEVMAVGGYTFRQLPTTEIYSPCGPR